MDREIKLTTPIRVGGAEKTTLHFRHNLRVGDMLAAERYMLSNGYDGSAMDALINGNIGVMLAIMESLCQLPPGTLEQLSLDDFAALSEATQDFFATSPGTGAGGSGS